jgi:hypothetical protein
MDDEDRGAKQGGAERLIETQSVEIQPESFLISPNQWAEMQKHDEKCPGRNIPVVYRLCKCPIPDRASSRSEP